MRFWDYLRYRRRMLLAAAVCCVIFAASFALYRLPLRAVLYPVGLCLLVGLGFAVWDYRRTLKRHRALTGYGDLTAELLRELPPPESLAEEDYRAQLLHLRQLCTELQSAADNRYRDAIEYYTTWAHQIKTPIASMRLALQGEDTALFRRLLSDLSRTEQYVEMVMAFLRLEDAPGDYVFREVALDEVLRQALRRFSAEFIDRRLRLDYTPTGLTVLTDEKWLCFVLEQLLSNALKYTREGSITVELAGERVLAIRDTGIGMTQDFIDNHLFEAFSQEDNAARSQYGGTGLGMSIVSQLVQKMNGTITVESTVGEGSSFTVTLPFAIDHDPPAAGPEKEASTDLHGKRLLVVEDNELNMEIAEFMLKSAGAEVVKAFDGESAVRAFAADPAGCDAILMDLMMPVMDGYAAARAIRASGQPRAGTVPIIAMSANAYAEDVKKCLDSGMNAHISKPLFKDVMLRTIARFV